MVEILGDALSEACRNNRMAWVVGFMNFEEKIDGRSTGCSNDEFGDGKK